MRTPLPLIGLLPALGGCTLEHGVERIPSPPEVELSGPREILRQGNGPALLQGQARDRHDAPADLRLRWLLDGSPLGDPFQDEDAEVELGLDIDALALGPHLVGLRAVDLDQDLAEAEVIIEVQGPLGSPEVRITAPAPGSSFEIGSTIAFQGEASDLSTPADALRFDWESDLDGPLEGAISADGQSVLVTEGLSLGTHEVRLTVTDLDGELGLDRVVIQVVEPVEDPPDDPPDDEDPPDEDVPVDAEPGDLVLSELMINPDVVQDTVGEWFELYNTSSSPISIQGYTLEDEDYDTWVIDVPMVVPAHSYFVVCASMDPASNGGVETCDAGFLRPTLPPPGMAFGNEGDEVILVRPDGVEIDRLEYTAAWVSTAVAVGVDPSLLSAEDNDDIDAWCLQRSVLSSGGEPGTPGVENDPCP